MKVDRNLIKHVADVSRLKLTEPEIKEFLPQLREILDAFSEIGKIDTKGLDPSYHAIEIKNSIREDIPEKCLDNSAALRNTQHKKDGYFKGPKVV